MNKGLKEIRGNSIQGRRLILVFFVALGLRCAVLTQVIGHEQLMLQPDSRIYTAIAESLLKHGSFHSPEEPVPTYLVRTPGYPFFLASLLWVTGGSLIAVVLVQIILDSVSCVLVSYLGERVWKGGGTISGLLASINLGMITYSNFVLSDSLFLLFFLMSIIGMLRFLQTPRWRFAVSIGTGLGIAGLIRSVIIYLPLLLIPFFAFFLRIRQNERLRKTLGKSGLVGLLFLLCLLPWLIRNQVHYGRFSLSAQSGEHLLQYVVPFVWQHSRGLSFIEGMKRAGEELQEKARKKGLDISKANPFDVNDLQVKVALEYLRQEPLSAYLKAWTLGISKNLLAPAIIDLSYLLNIERPHFYYTEGRTSLERAWNFLRSIQGGFGWVVIGSLFGLLLARAIQLWGLFLLVRERAWEGGLLLLIIAYFLIISGPVGYAKYRLPYEPILIIFLAVGIRDLYGRWMGKRVTRHEGRE